MLSCVQVTPPTKKVASIAEVRARLRITKSSNDAELSDMIDAATAMLDGPSGLLGRALCEQTLQLTLDEFPGAWGKFIDERMGCAGFRLPFPPVQSISSVKYDDTTGAEQTLDSSVYRLTGVGSDEVRFSLSIGQSWPSTYCRSGAVRIQFVAGYETVPAPIKQAVILMVQSLYNMSERNLFISSETVAGVGSRTFVAGNASQVIQAAADALLAPYRSVPNHGC